MINLSILVKNLVAREVHKEVVQHQNSVRVKMNNLPILLINLTPRPVRANNRLLFKREQRSRLRNFRRSCRRVRRRKRKHPVRQALNRS